MLIGKEIDKKKSIGQVAEELGVRTHVIRFWESKFPQIKPQIGKGGRRYYFKKEVEILKTIRNFLYQEGYSITGLQKLLKQRKSSQKKTEKEHDLQLLLAADDSSEEDSTSFIAKDDKQLISNLVKNIESNLEKFEQIFQKDHL